MVDQLWLWILDGNTIITSFLAAGEEISPTLLGYTSRFENDWKAPRKKKYNQYTTWL